MNSKPKTAKHQEMVTTLQARLTYLSEDCGEAHLTPRTILQFKRNNGSKFAAARTPSGIQYIRRG